MSALGTLASLATHPVVFVLGLALVVLFLLYPNTIVGSRIRRDIPISDGALPIVGHQLSLGKHRARRLERIVDVAEKYGDISRSTFYSPATGIVDVLFIFHPADVEYFYRVGILQLLAQDPVALRCVIAL